MSNPQDNIKPSGKWVFDAQVANVFDDMLERSIPQYQVMRDAVTQLAIRHAQPRTDIIDLGSSRGRAIQPIRDKLGTANRYVLTEISEPMLSAMREDMADDIDNGLVSVVNCDLRWLFPVSRASVILSVLTLQFTPIEYRLQILQRAYQALEPGGAFILVEKVIEASAGIDETFIDLYYNLKADHQYSKEAVERKRLSLEGVLVPVTAGWNEQLLRNTGYSQVDCFWRWMNFAGWIGVK